MGRSLARKVKGRYGNLLPRQRKLLEAALKGGVNRSLAHIADEAGIPRGTVYRWIRENERFRDAWGSLCDEAVLRHAPAVTSALVSKATEGDVAGMRLFYDVSGRLKSGTSVTVNTGVNLDVDSTTDTEIARRAIFMFEQWLATGREIPERIKRMGAKFYQAKQERAASVGIELPGSQAESRPVDTEDRPHRRPNVTRTLLELEQREKTRSQGDDNGVPIGTSYGAHGFEQAADPKVVTNE